MLEKIKKQWFLIGLVIVFVSVILDSSRSLETAGRILKDLNGPQVMIFLIFVISGLMLDVEQIRSGVRDARATGIALLIIMILAPMAAWLLSYLPLQPGIIIGLFIVSVMPTTLSSGVVMTQAAGGNMAHALFVTIVSNIMAIFSIPIVLSLLLSALEMEKTLLVDKSGILLKLVVLVLLPLLCGLFLKIKVFSGFDPGRYRLQWINQALILSIVFVSVATARQAFLTSRITFVSIAVMTGLFHFILLGAAWMLIKIFHIEKGRFESILFMGAQKTLPLSVIIQVSYFSDFGLALVVCVSHHIVHLIIDGYLSTQLAKS